MIFRKFIFISFLLKLTLSFSQEIKHIKGRFLDKDNLLPIDSVQIKINNKIIEVSKIDGRFNLKIEVPNKFTITIQHNDYNKLKIPINTNEQSIDLYDFYLQKINTSVNYILEPTIIDKEKIEYLQSSQFIDDQMYGIWSDEIERNASFNLRTSNFKLRGYHFREQQLFLNKMNINSLYSGYSNWSFLRGLNDLLKSNEQSEGVKPLSVGQGRLLSSVNINTPAKNISQMRKVISRFVSPNSIERQGLTYGTEFSEYGLMLGLSAVKTFESSPFYEKGGRENMGIYTGVGWNINEEHELNLTLIHNQTLSNSTTYNTKEVYNYKGYAYNSSWGWQSNEKRNANQRLGNHTIAQLNYDWFINDYSLLSLGFMYYLGSQSASRLQYFDAENPYPTYYRKMPSYFESTGNEKTGFSVLKNFLNQPETYQINWKSLYKVNSINPQAVYFQSSDVNLTDEKSFVVHYEREFEENLNLDFNVSYRNEHSFFFARLDDLLGAQYQLDVDPFETDDRRFNNLLDKSRKNKVEDKINYFYGFTTQQINTNSLLRKSFSFFETYLSTKIVWRDFVRKGYFKNGIYPDISLGESKIQSHFGYGAKIGSLIYINRLNIIDVNFFYNKYIPNGSELFVDIRRRNDYFSNYTQPEVFDFNLKYQFKYQSLNFAINFYETHFKNQTQIRNYYTEGIEFNKSDYIREIVRGITSVHRGLELNISYPISDFDVVLNGYLGDFHYVGKANLTIISDEKDKSEFDFGEVYLEGLKVPNIPQFAISLGANFNTSNGWYISFNTHYTTNNYIQKSLIQRTASFFKDSDGVPIPNISQSEIQTLFYQEKLTELFFSHLFVSKGWRIFNSYLNVYCIGQNIFNAMGFKQGYEQSRFANYRLFKEDNVRATPLFSPKYKPVEGAKYVLGLQLFW